MIPAAAGSLAFAVVLGVSARFAPPSARVRAVASLVPTRETSSVRRAPLTALGAAVLRRAGRDASPAVAARVGMACAGAGVGLLLGPLWMGVGLAGGAAAASLGSRRMQRRQADAVVGELPDVVDLLAVAVGGGLTIRLALEYLTASRPQPDAAPVTAALAAALDRVRAGDRLADALAELPGHVGDAVRPLVAALVATERTGAPVLPALHRLAAESRARRRRRAEERARALPVKLLFPLVVCVLPAFGLLTVVPLIAGALRGLQL